MTGFQDRWGIFSKTEEIDLIARLLSTISFGRSSLQLIKCADQGTFYEVLTILDRVGGALTNPDLPHHHAYGSVHGGS